VPPLPLGWGSMRGRGGVFWCTVKLIMPTKKNGRTRDEVESRTLLEVFGDQPPEAKIAEVIKACDFQVLSFHDPKALRQDGLVGSEVILIYALGVDGIIREFANGRWTAFPITS